MESNLSNKEELIYNVINNAPYHWRLDEVWNVENSFVYTSCLVIFLFFVFTLTCAVLSTEDNEKSRRKLVKFFTLPATILPIFCFVSTYIFSNVDIKLMKKESATEIAQYQVKDGEKIKNTLFQHNYDILFYDSENKKANKLIEDLLLEKNRKGYISKQEKAFADLVKICWTESKYREWKEEYSLLEKSFILWQKIKGMLSPSLAKQLVLEIGTLNPYKFEKCLLQQKEE